MDLLLLPILSVLTIIVMWCTLRSPVFGLAGSVSVAAIAAFSGTAAVHWLAPVAGGFIMGLMAGARLRPSLVILSSGVPVGIALAILYQIEGAEALRQELLTGFRETGNALNLPDSSLSPEQLVDVAITLLPSFTVLMIVLIMGLSYSIARRLLARFDLVLRPVAPLALWRLPFAVVWSFVIGLVLTAVGWSMQSPPLKMVGGNLCVLHGAAFFIIGVAVVRYLLVARGVSNRVQVLIAMLAVPIMILVPLQLVLSGVGLFDMWFDFRRLERVDTPINDGL